MVTTIQLNEKTKAKLDKLKSKKETYEQVIVKLMNEAEKNKRRQKELLIEGYKEMAEDSLKICREWKHADAELDWEWDENEN